MSTRRKCSHRPLIATLLGTLGLVFGVPLITTTGGEPVSAIPTFIPIPTLGPLPTLVPAGGFSVTPTTWTFPNTYVHAVTTQTVTITNLGLTTETPSFSGGAPNNPTNFGGSQNCAGVPLAPGGSCQFTYTFEPQTVGTFTTSTTIGIDADNFSLTMTGTAIDPFTVGPTTLAFPVTPVGGTSAIPVVIRNVSDVPQTPNYAGGAPNNPTHFGGSQNCAGVTLAPGAACAFTYTYKPTALGAHSSSTSIQIDSVTYTISLSGSSTNTFFALPVPIRLMDTRPGESTVDGNAVGEGKIPGGSVRQLQISDRASIPTGLTAVALNVTATNTSGPGFVTLFACNPTPPNASHVNFTGAGQTTPNAVLSKLDPAGKLCIFASATTDVIVDIVGYFPTTQSFVPLDAPARLQDTRSGEKTIDLQAQGEGAIVGGTSRPLQITGRATVPLNALTVALNVTATNTTAPGFLAVYSCDQQVPNTSNVNFTSAGQTRPNAVISKVDATGKLCVFASATTDVIVDIIGYFPTAQSFTALAAPVRLQDTRPGTTTIDGVAQGIGAINGGSTRQLQVAGRPSVPSTARTVALNVTATNTTAPGFLAVFACDQSLPNTSNVNFTGAGQTTPNAVISKLDSAGKLCIHASATTDVIVDIVGYFP